MNIMQARLEKLCELLGVDADLALRDYRRYPRVRKLVSDLLGLPTVERQHGPCYRRAQAARALGVKSKTVKRWIKDGKIIAVTGPNGEELIPESEVRRVAALRKHMPKRKYTKRDKGYWGIA